MKASRWLAAVMLLSSSLCAGEDFKPEIFPASDEAAQAVKNIQLPPGIQAELVAAEPQLANPVALYVDFKGRIYISETFRAGLGCQDEYFGPNIDEDLPIRTCDERLDFLKRKWGENFSKFTERYERVRLLEDTDGDGRADRDSVFFQSNGPLDGIAAGVLSYKGDVYWANVPNLWKLRDTNNDGKADMQQVLHYGFGVHGGIRGHDLHGLRIGPDGKLYMSIGDRGFHVTTPDKTISFPDTGGVLRCNLDGSDLEVFFTGLRNPEDLIFDEYGNLFTVDNDSGGSDQCRLMYLPEGGDGAWRNAFQFLGPPQLRGVWNLEKMWHAPHKGQAAFLIPAITHFTNGPSGITYYPGVGWPDFFKRRFFIVDFRYSAAGSSIESFQVKAKGAGFECENRERSIWNVLATDADFGPDCCMYITDWVAGGEMPKKGRVYRLFDPAQRNSAEVREVQRLLAEGVEKQPLDALVRLLGHKDQRVRQEAQFALAALGKKGIEPLQQSAQGAREQLARIHGIWGLGQLGRAYKSAAKALVPLLEDGDAEIRAQAAKILGDVRYRDAYKRLLPLLTDASLRVRYFAALSLGKLQNIAAIPALIETLRANNDEDAYLRHAAVMGLVNLNAPQVLLKYSADKSTAVRMGVLVALRRLARAEVANFLDDQEPLIVNEAARAIHDAPIYAALPELAKKIGRISPAAGLLGEEDLNRALVLRLINANFRLGGPEEAQALVTFARRKDATAGLRANALQALALWVIPPGRDRVLNMWRPLPPRDGAIAANALQPVLLELLDDDAPEVKLATVQAAAAHKMTAAAPKLHGFVEQDDPHPLECRIAALNALGSIGDANLRQAITAALGSKEVKLRQAALVQIAGLSANEAVPLMKTALDKGATAEKQTVIGLLAKFQRPDANAILDELLAQLLDRKLKAELHLDVLEAAQACGEAALRDKAVSFQKAVPADDELAPFKICLTGGDGDIGRKIFYENHKVQCLRCHKINGKGGDVGPDLKGIAAKHDRNYLLQSLIQPNEQIAEGFALNLVTLNDGQILTGNLIREDDKVVSLRAADGKVSDVAKADIRSRKQQKASAMPPMAEQLTKREIRDVMEFLARLTK